MPESETPPCTERAGDRSLVDDRPGLADDGVHVVEGADDRLDVRRRQVRVDPELLRFDRGIAGAGGQGARPRVVEPETKPSVPTTPLCERKVIVGLDVVEGARVIRVPMREWCRRMTTRSSPLTAGSWQLAPAAGRVEVVDVDEADRALARRHGHEHAAHPRRGRLGRRARRAVRKALVLRHAQVVERVLRLEDREHPRRHRNRDAIGGGVAHGDRQHRPEARAQDDVAALPSFWPV